MDEGTVSIRNANPEDWDQISKLSSISGYEDYINEMGPIFLQDGTILMAENKILLGFMKITILPDGYAWFSAVRVHPDYRRHGVGNNLLLEALERSHNENAGGCRLMIEDSNFRSKGLALKNGFHEVLDLLLFEGGFSLEGLEEDQLNADEYISMGWEFCRFNSRLKDCVLKYTLDDGKLYQYEGEKGKYQFITKPFSTKISTDVRYSAVPYQDVPVSFPLKPVEGFRRAQVFEIKF